SSSASEARSLVRNPRIKRQAQPWQEPSVSVWPFGVSRHGLASRSVGVRSPSSALLLELLLTVGPLPVPLQELRFLVVQQLRCQVISSVGHPSGYSGFSGGGKGLPRGPIEVSPCRPRRFRSGLACPGEEMTPFASPSPREGRGFGGSAPVKKWDHQL